ncbi:hypothetical protein NADRNF5_1683 [Nitrosopumilus adriaticus]|uniref:Uncharacterized protein n=1 Tax=Nitrosopumilus adriaticus TaxID=1580092 RepID=A0A0D5C4Q7_9ARCH|nr:hypothetical protein NADRNF5_1683 [Nitrosopumilus adriaticus]
MFISEILLGTTEDAIESETITSTSPMMEIIGPRLIINIL